MQSRRSAVNTNNDHRSSFIVHCSFFIVSLLILAGCGGTTPTPVSVPPTPIPTFVSPTAIPTPTRESLPMIVTLKLWLPEELDLYARKAGADTLAQQLSNFSNTYYPDLQVEVTVKKAHGRGGLLDFMRTARDAAPAILPDLVVLDAADLETVTGSGLIQPLDNFLAQSAASDHFPFATTMGQVGGQTMGVVIGVDMQHMAYRPALFDAPPLSWQQVISSPAPFLFPAGGYDGKINDATLIQYLGAGGKLSNPDGAPWLNEEALVSVFDFYSKCITTTVIAPTTILTITHVDQAWEQFKDGQSGMTVVRAGRYWLEADEDIAAAPIPTRSEQPISIARGWALAMVTDDPVRQDLAMLLFDWLTAPDHNAQWTQASGYLPATRSALRLWRVSNEEQAMLRNLMEAAIPAPRPEVMATIGPIMQEALEVVLEGRATPEEAAADAIEDLED
jgi:ABC-type glycerol-3-phosphate transport system substrate-binding protein